MILLEKLKKVFKRFKRNPVEEVYFESPAFLKRWHEFLMKNKWVRGGILVAILGVLAWGAYLLAYKIEEPQDLSELLPADDTIAYVEISIEQYQSMMSSGKIPLWLENLPFTDLITELEAGAEDPFLIYSEGQPSETVAAESLTDPRTEPVETGLGDCVGIAWIYNNSFIEEWKFYEVKDQTTALKTLQLDGFVDSPYEFIGDYLVTGGGTLLLDKIEAVFNNEEPSLKKDENFMKLRPNLPYDPAVFFYAKPAELETWLKWGWNLDVETLGTTFPKATISLQALSHSLPLFPAMGAVIDPDGTSIRIQTYWVGDKTKLGALENLTFFHNDKKYKGKLFHYFPETISQLFGGQNVAGGSGPGFVHQLAYVLDAADGVSGTALEQWMNEKIMIWFGTHEAQRSALPPDTGHGAKRSDFSPSPASHLHAASVLSRISSFSPAFSPSEAEYAFFDLFSREFALGLFQLEPVCTFNPETDTEQVCAESTLAYILALEIDNDERGARGLVTDLFEILLARGYLEINTETSTLSVSALTSNEAEEDDISYTQIFKENGNLLCAFVVYDEILFIATSDEALRAVIQTATGNQASFAETNTYLNVEKLLSSGDQLWATQSGDFQIVSSFNGFDDGFGTLHLVTPIIFQTEDDTEVEINIEIDTPIDTSAPMDSSDDVNE